MIKQRAEMQRVRRFRSKMSEIEQPWKESPANYARLSSNYPNLFPNKHTFAERRPFYGDGKIAFEWQRKWATFCRRFWPRFSRWADDRVKNRIIIPSFRSSATRMRKLVMAISRLVVRIVLTKRHLTGILTEIRLFVTF